MRKSAVRPFEREADAMEVPAMMLDTGRFYALDTVARNEIITFLIVDEDDQKGLWFMALTGQEKGSFSPASLGFFGLFMEFE